MLTILILLVCGIEPAPRPPQAPSIEARLAAHDLAIAELRADLAAYKAHYGSAPVKESLTTPVGYVAVTGAKEVNGFHPVKAAVNVATAPVKVLGTICQGGVCRQVTEYPEVTNWTDVGIGEPAGASWSSGSCSGGQCGMQTRRGWFGRRR